MLTNIVNVNEWNVTIQFYILFSVCVLILWCKPFIAVTLKSRLPEGSCKCILPLGTILLMPPGWLLCWCLGPVNASIYFSFCFFFSRACLTCWIFTRLSCFVAGQINTLLISCWYRMETPHLSHSKCLILTCFYKTYKERLLIFYY